MTTLGKLLFLVHYALNIVPIFILITLIPQVTAATEIHIGTEAKGSFSHFTGKAMCRVIQMDSSFSCSTIPLHDSTQNLTNLRSGALDLALMDSKTLHDAISKRGTFQFLDISYDNLKALMPLYTVSIVLVVREDSEIESIDDLEEKRINAGVSGSLQYLTLNSIMSAKGWSEKSFSLFEEISPTLSQDVLAFKKGTVQAMLHIGPHPDAGLQRLLNRSQASLVNIEGPDLEKVTSDDSGFKKVKIPKDTYTAYPKRLSTIGTQVFLIASDEIDDETVLAILQAVTQNRDKLKMAHPSLGQVNVVKGENTFGKINLHPAAAKFYLGKNEVLNF